MKQPNAIPMKRGLVQGLGVLATIALTMFFVIEISDAASPLMRIAAIMKYAGFGLIFAWPLLKGDDRQTLSARAIVGFCFVLFSVGIVGGVRLGYF